MNADRVIVVDDEAAAAAILPQMLAEHPRFTFVGECA